MITREKLAEIKSYWHKQELTRAKKDVLMLLQEVEINLGIMRRCYDGFVAASDFVFRSLKCDDGYIREERVLSISVDSGVLVDWCTTEAGAATRFQNESKLKAKMEEGKP